MDKFFIDAYRSVHSDEEYTEFYRINTILDAYEDANTNGSTFEKGWERFYMGTTSLDYVVNDLDKSYETNKQVIHRVPKVKSGDMIYVNSISGGSNLAEITIDKSNISFIDELYKIKDYKYDKDLYGLSTTIVIDLYNHKKVEESAAYGNPEGV